MTFLLHPFQRLDITNPKNITRDLDVTCGKSKCYCVIDHTIGCSIHRIECLCERVDVLDEDTWFVRFDRFFEHIWESAELLKECDLFVGSCDCVVCIQLL